MAHYDPEIIGELPSYPKPKLHRIWIDLCGRPAPSKLRKELMIRILAYRIQEKAYGRLSSATQKRLRVLARLFGKDPKATLPDVPLFKPGTRLIRNWNGEVHEATILEKGYDYRGKRYASLSKIARAITGTQWSGPLFFGLKSKNGVERDRGK